MQNINIIPSKPIMPSGNVVQTPNLNPSQVHNIPGVFPTSQPGINFPGIMPSNLPGLMPSNLLGAIPTNYQGYMASYYQGMMQSNYPWIPASQYPGFMPTNYQGFMASNYPGAIPTNYQGYMASNYPGVMQSNYPWIPPSQYPGFKPTNLPGIMPTKLPGFMNSLLPGIMPTKVPGINPSMYAGHSAWQNIKATQTFPSHGMPSVNVYGPSGNPLRVPSTITDIMTIPEFVEARNLAPISCVNTLAYGSSSPDLLDSQIKLALYRRNLQGDKLDLFDHLTTSPGK